MTFFEYMQQQTKRNDVVAHIAIEMKFVSRLFPSQKLGDASAEEWRTIVNSRYNFQYDANSISDGFEQAVKEFSEVEND